MAKDAFPIGLAAQFRRNTALYGAGAIVLVLQQSLMAYRDLLVAKGVDAADKQLGEATIEAAMLIVGVSIVASAARVLSRVTIFRGGRNVEYELRAVFLDRLHALGPAFFRRVPTGEIMSRATSDLTQVRLLLGFGVLNVISSVLSFASGMYVMGQVSWKLTFAAMSMLPVLLLITRNFSVRMFTFNRATQQAIGEMSDRVLASLSGVRVVRAFSLEGSEQDAFERKNRDYLDKSLELARIRGSMGPIMGALSAFGVLIVFWYGGNLIISGEISKGGFVSFWLALLRILWPMMAIGFVAAIVQRGRAGYERLCTVFHAQPDIVDGPIPAPQHSPGALTVHGLSYAHGARCVLSDVSFAVPAGSSVALIGKTGSGKSTLAALMARLLPCDRGAVFLDGVDVCDLPLRFVRSAIGYAQQEAFLFSTTVADNIGYALPEVDSPEAARRIEQACREAQVWEEVCGLPEGLHTVVGERGVQLSGGQRQRVALARALVAKPAVLILDDPLSAVDAKTEAAILDVLARKASERTVVLITNRPAAALRCDQVVMLDEGAVLEMGAPEELTRRGGAFSRWLREHELEESLAQPNPAQASGASL